jgi:hypothetical protein
LIIARGKNCLVVYAKMFNRVKGIIARKVVLTMKHNIMRIHRVLKNEVQLLEMTTERIYLERENRQSKALGGDAYRQIV